MAERLCCVTPNWAEYASWDPTDTTRPPRSFPPEWNYVAHEGALETYIIDAYTRNLSAAETARLVLDGAPRWVAISSTPSYLFWRCPPLGLEAVAGLSRMLKAERPDLEVVVVGPHGTVAPAEVLAECPDVDLVFLGEPDQLLTRTLVATSSDSSAWLVSRESSGARRAAPQHPLGRGPACADWVAGEPHCWLPSAAKFLGNRRASLLETSRGCSFDCDFCLRAGFRRDLRTKPLDYVAEEIRALTERGVEYVFLIDETFGLPRRHARSVAELLGAAGLIWGAQTRPDLWTADGLRHLARNGCVYMEVGLETLDLEAQRQLGKLSHPEKIATQLATFNECIPFVGFNTFDVMNPDIPGRPEGADVGHDIEGRTAGSFIPYPGTPWGDHALARLGFDSPSWIAARMAHSLFKTYERDPIRSAELRASLEARRSALRAERPATTHDRTRFEEVVRPTDNGDD